MKKIIFAVILLFGFSWSAITLSQTITRNLNSYAGFGYSMDFENDFLAISARGAQEGPNAAGAVYIYQKNNNLWEYKQTLYPADGLADDRYGEEIDLAGNYLIVGAPFNDEVASGAGAGYIYKYDGNNWVFENKITASIAAADDSFGSSVYISDDYAFLASSDNDLVAVNGGAVAVFKNNNGIWQEEAIVTAGQTDSNRFGCDLAYENGFLYIGEFENNRVHIFQNINDVWQHQGTITGSDISANDGFGVKVYVKNSLMLIAAVYQNNFTGAGYIFEKNNGVWTEIKKLMADDPKQNAFFGMGDINANYAAVASPYQANGGVYIFQNNNSNWDQIVSINNYQTDSFFGVNALSDYGFLAASAINQTINGVNGVGAVYIYSGMDPVGGSFNGTPKDQIISAASTNIVITALGLTQNASTNGIADNAVTVLEINGLVAERTAVNDTALGTESGNVYKGLVPGQEYSVDITALSRGNDVPDNDTVQISVALDDADPDTWLNNAPVNLTIQPWQTQTFIVTVNPAGAYSYERATLNATISLVAGSAPRITSYNAFADAYIGGTFESKGIYGGVETLLENTFTLEAEGFNITILNRAATVNAPAIYNGEAITSLNIVPGTKIKYTIVLKNNSTAEAPSINLTDVIPENCHLYYTEAPAVEGAALWAWRGAENNNADRNTADAVKFEITIPAEGIVTASYSVTLD